MKFQYLWLRSLPSRGDVCDIFTFILTLRNCCCLHIFRKGSQRSYLKLGVVTATVCCCFCCCRCSSFVVIKGPDIEIGTVWSLSISQKSECLYEKSLQAESSIFIDCLDIHVLGDLDSKGYIKFIKIGKLQHDIYAMDYEIFSTLIFVITNEQNS